MAEVSQGLCKFSSPSVRLLHCVAEQHYAYSKEDYATTNGFRLPEEESNHARKGVAINRDASYSDAQLFVALPSGESCVFSVHFQCLDQRAAQ